MLPRLFSLNSNFSKISFFFSLCLFCASFQITKSQTPKPTKTPFSTTLELNKPIEREISGTQRDSYQIILKSNQYLKILIEQRGIDIGARLYDPVGKQLADFDTEFNLKSTETIEFVPKTEGTYRFDIINKYPFLAAGKYEIKLVDLHTASEKEKKQQEARILHADSIRFFNSGKYNEAKQSIEGALAINQNELGLENQTIVINLTQLARIVDAQSEYEEAEKINQQVLAIEGKIFEANNPHTANTLNYLATNYNHQENYPKAVEYHQRALAMREKIFGDSHPIVAVSLLNLGVVYSFLGDKQKAIEFYQKALVIQEKTAGELTFNTAVMVNNIGEIYNDLEEYQKAEPFFLRAIAILEKIFQPDNPRIFDVLENLALCYAGLRKFEKAEPLYFRILAAREKTFGANHPSTAHAAFNLGNLYSLKNESEKAQSFYKRALEIRENKFGDDSPVVSEVLSALASLLAEKGDLDQSLKLQQRSNEIDEHNISLNLTIGSERQKLAYLNNLFDRTNQSIFIQTKFAADNPLAVELAVTTILRQKGRVLDAVANDLTGLRRRANPQDKELLDKLNKITQEVSELILTGSEGTSIAEHQVKIKKLIDEREKLEDEISRRVAGFYPKSQAVTFQSVQRRIPDDYALVEFAVYTPFSLLADKAESANKERYVVYVLHNQGEIKWKDLGETKQIDGLIDSFRKSLRDPKSTDTKQLSRTLEEKIMKPVRSQLGNSKNLLISPDGELNLIPFEALIDEQNHYLIENYSLTYLTSGRDLLRLQTPKESKGKPVIIANPSFGQPFAQQTGNLQTVKKARGKRTSITVTRNLSDIYFAPLSATALEAKSIQTLFPEAEFLDRNKATEIALKQINAPKLLHIATHGFFLEDNGKVAKVENPLLRSGLALAGANQRTRNGDDGILTALEASNLNLWGTKLVVLSACDTGLGEVKNGEGVYGLRRAFVIAGTESLVMSLWSVSDLVTRELMTNYYKNLKKGLGRNDALRQLQLEMLKKPNRQHPFYWAGFIQSGEWANLEGKR